MPLAAGPPVCPGLIRRPRGAIAAVRRPLVATAACARIPTGAGREVSAGLAVQSSHAPYGRALVSAGSAALATWLWGEQYLQPIPRLPSGPPPSRSRTCRRTVWDRNLIRAFSVARVTDGVRSNSEFSCLSVANHAAVSAERSGEWFFLSLAPPPRLAAMLLGEALLVRWLNVFGRCQETV
jgi:hypothetical protein